MRISLQIDPPLTDQKLADIEQLLDCVGAVLGQVHKHFICLSLKIT
jgi:hypothetical protein